VALYAVSAVLPDPTFCKQPKKCLKQQCFGHLQNVGSGNAAETVQCHLETLQSKAELTKKDIIVHKPDPNKYYIPAFKTTLTGGQALPVKTLFNFVQEPLEHFSGLFSGVHHSLDEDTLRLSRHS
jgi:hypothetical protein